VLTAGKCSTGVHQREPKRDDKYSDPDEPLIAGRTRLGKAHRFSLLGWLSAAISGLGCVLGYPG
jgi:hypothetical protein